MLLERERFDVARAARRLVRDGLVVATAGNVSVRSGRLVAITPTSVEYDEVDAAAVVVVDETGEVVDGALRPSSELAMHLAAYTATGAGAVVHTHSPCATALAVAGLELAPLHAVAVDLGGRVPVAPYATFGTDALAESVAACLPGHPALLLERHGTLTVGSTLAEAYRRALELEWLAELHVRAAALGPLVPLDDEELARIAARSAELPGRARPRLTALGA